MDDGTDDGMDDGTDEWMESFISSRRPLLYVISAPTVPSVKQKFLVSRETISKNNFCCGF